MFLNSNKQIYKIIRFSFVGIVNTLIDLIILNLLVYLFNVTDPLIFTLCKAASFLTAVVNSYFMNKYFTFKSSSKSIREFYLFIIISLIGLLVNIISATIIYQFLGLYSQLNVLSANINATIAGLFGSVISMTINYLSYSHVVFKK